MGVQSEDGKNWRWTRSIPPEIDWAGRLTPVPEEHSTLHTEIKSELLPATDSQAPAIW